MEFKMIYGTVALLAGIISAYLLTPIILVFFCLFCAALYSTITFYLYGKNVNIKMLLVIIVLFLIGTLDYSFFSNRKSKSIAFEGEPIDVSILILEEGYKKSYSSTYMGECKEIIKDNNNYSLKEKIIIRDYGDDQYKSGDLIKARGSFEGIIGKRNFGDNDIELYYNSKGIYNQFNVLSSEKIGKSVDYRVLLFYNIRNKISRIIYESLPREEAAFLSAVIIGDKHSLDDEEKDNYSKTGLAHLLSISGLHVAFIVFLINQAIKALKIKKGNNLISTLLIVYYVAMIGVPPSALRSLIMMLVAIWGKHIKRDYDMISAASFAAIIMLLFNPLLIHNQGFVISFACIYSIAILYEPVYNFLGKIIINLPIRKAFALSLSVQLGITPLLIYYFNYLPLISILINIIAIPLVFVIIATGFMGVIAGSIIPFLGAYIFSLTYYSINILSMIVNGAALLPLSGFYIPSLPLPVYLAYILIIVRIFFKECRLCIYMRKFRITATVILLVLIFLLFGKSVINQNIRLTFLDVGQGDSSLITTAKGRNVLIDGGGSSGKGDYYFDVGSKITVPALLKLGVSRLDTIIVSHIHEDHLEGLIKTIETLKTGQVIMPHTPYESNISKKFLELCRDKGINVIYANDGDKVILDKYTEIEILFPEKTLLRYTNSDENNNSIVALLKYKNFRALYTGDIEKEGEKALLGKDIRADVLKIPHHGSNTSSTEEFIKTVSPEAFVVSVGKNNFGHPRKEVLERLKVISKDIYRTDNNGAVSLKTDGNKVIIKTVR